jgi:hypothetical protein
VHPDEETFSACTKSTLDSNPTVVSDETIKVLMLMSLTMTLQMMMFSWMCNQ